MLFTSSGLRGKVGSELTPNEVLKVTECFAAWIGKGSQIIVGQDTRNSSIIFSNIVKSGLMSMGIDVFDAGISPTPMVLHQIQNHNFNGGVVITGSHNSEDQNGIKFIGNTHTFVDNEEIEELLDLQKKEKHFTKVDWFDIGKIQQIDLYPLYKKRLGQFINKKKITPNLKVVVDPNAGAVSGLISILLEYLGCSVKQINSKFQNYPYFPRIIEPIAENLSQLQKIVQKDKANIGFAFDCDGDRVTIVGPDGEVYPEDISVLLPLFYYLNENKSKSSTKDVIIVTNIASSLAFDDIAEKFHGKIIRTPIGEQYLAKKMAELQKSHPNSLILGGEGSSGGFMYPYFNNARDGIFAACKICEMLSSREDKLSELVKIFPKYHVSRENVPITDPVQVINAVHERLRDKNISHTVIGNDIRVYSADTKEWTLVHPSNTEPVIRIIAESKEKNRSVELVKIMRNLMLQ